MNTSASGSMPAASSIASSSLPAWPTNASPRRSSSAPGASPISSQRACCGVPRPNTVCVRVCDSRQRRQSATSSRSWIQRSASVSGRGTSASAIPAGAAADASPLPREPATGDVRGVCLPVAAGGASSQTGTCTRGPLSPCQGSASQLASAWSSSQAGWPVSGSPTALPCASRDDEPDMEPDTGVCSRWMTSWAAVEDPDMGSDTGADAGTVRSGTGPFAGTVPSWPCPAACTCRWEASAPACETSPVPACTSAGTSSAMPSGVSKASGNPSGIPSGAGVPCSAAGSTAIRSPAPGRASARGCHSGPSPSAAQA